MVKAKIIWRENHKLAQEYFDEQLEFLRNEDSSDKNHFIREEAVVYIKQNIRNKVIITDPSVVTKHDLEYWFEIIHRWNFNSEMLYLIEDFTKEDFDNFKGINEIQRFINLYLDDIVSYIGIRIGYQRDDEKRRIRQEKRRRKENRLLFWDDD